MMACLTASLWTPNKVQVRAFITICTYSALSRSKVARGASTVQASNECILDLEVLNDMLIFSTG